MTLVYWTVQCCQFWLLWEVWRHTHWSVCVLLVVVGVLQRNLDRERQTTDAALWAQMSMLKRELGDMSTKLHAVEADLASLQATTRRQGDQTDVMAKLRALEAALRRPPPPSSASTRQY